MIGTTRLRTHAVVALVLTVSPGCSPGDAPDPTVSVRDSAGVTIYENSGGEWTEATAWKLSTEPILTIGALDGREEYLLFQVSGARRLSNGNLVITNGGSQELHFYDPNGRHVRSVGGEGDGPGEFRSDEFRPMGPLWPLGSDSIAVWDSGNQRLTVFDIDGDFGRSFRLDPIPGVLALAPRGILDDNSMLVAGLDGLPPEGRGWFPNSYARTSLEGAHLTTLVQRPGGESNVPPTGIAGTLPYRRVATVTAFGNRWYYGSSDSWEIAVYSQDGVLTHLFRRDEPNRAITQEMIDEFRDPFADPRVQATFALQGISAPPMNTFPGTLPAYRSFVVSDDGILWVENYTHPSEQPSWAVFREDGRYLGDVETPMGAEVTHIGDDFVLVIWEDELEVQQVQMYELIKP